MNATQTVKLQPSPMFNQSLTGIDLQDPNDFSMVSTNLVHIELSQYEGGVGYLNIRNMDKNDRLNGYVASAYLKQRAMKAVKAKLVQIGKKQEYKTYLDQLIPMRGVSFSYRSN